MSHPIIVTGGAGFIGSNLVAALNRRGHRDVVVVDHLDADAKRRNLERLHYAAYYDKAEFREMLRAGRAPLAGAVFHLGACSSTTETDEGYLRDNNTRYTQDLCEWSLRHGARFIYASSAATYGDGGHGFSDDWSPAHLSKLHPMNLYGWSKHQFDIVVAERHVKKQKLPPHWAGLKFFNVYGPNEYHKGHMMSVLAKVFDSAKAGAPVKLFKSHKEGIADGDQRRDFIYVDDAIAVLRWLIDTPSVNGVFNVGTGKAESFRDMIGAMFKALKREPDIDYIDMPEAIRGQYQYFTQARVENLRRAGYNGGFTPLEDAVGEYVTGYLDRADRYR